MDIAVADVDFSCGIDETTIYDSTFLVEKTKESFVWFKDKEGPYIDFIMGYSSTNFGHCNPLIMKAIRRAIKGYDNLPAFNCVGRSSLDRKIINQLNKPGKEYRVYYTVGGAKAVDAAIKLLRAATGKNVILSFTGNFHGYSYGAMMLTDENFVHKSLFGEMPGDVVHFPFPNKYDSEVSYLDSLALMKAYIANNSESIAGIILEPLQGAAGFIQPPANFLPNLQEIAAIYNIPIVCDEIQTGIGRTGTFVFINQADFFPDIVLLGKSLAGGYYPLSAVIASKSFFESVPPQKSGFDSTFSNNNMAITIANAVMDILTDEMYSKIRKKGEKIFRILNKLQRYKIIKQVSFVGMAYSIEVDGNGDPKIAKKIAHEIKMEAFQRRLIIQTAGVMGNYLKISPSFFISDNTIKMSTEILDAACETVNNNWKYFCNE